MCKMKHSIQEQREYIAAHTAQDIADTVAAARDVFKLLGK